MVYLRCPEPSGLGGVGLVEGQSAIPPVLQICGTVTAYTISIISAISIIRTVLEEDIWVSQWNLAGLRLRQGGGMHSREQKEKKGNKDSLHSNHIV